MQSTNLPVLEPTSITGMVLPCLVIDEHRLVIKPTLDQMESFVINPLLTEDPKRRAENYRVQQAFEMRMKAQRLVGGNKAKRDNVPKYSIYLERGMVKGESFVTPPMSLVFLDKIEVFRASDTPSAVTMAHVPAGAKAFHDDGETQYLARLDLRNRHPETGKVPLAVVVDHSRDIEWGSQAFHDLNILGVPMNAAVAIAADNRDPATNLAKQLADIFPVLKGKVSFDARQVNAKGEAVMTITTLRRAVAASLIGRKVFALGNKPLTDDVTQDDRDEVTKLWNEVFDRLAPYLRHDTVVGLPVILTAIGIAVYEARSKNNGVGPFLHSLETVQWEKASEEGAKRWAGVAGKLTESGAFSAAGGVKDLGYRALDALTDPTSENYRKIRS